MTVREYIGARYVPLFMGEWSDENAYEPLSIVINQGNSYTSRQAVPIGIAITNEQYWALTGNYNAQIEQYRQEVQTLADSISGFETGLETETENRTAADTQIRNDFTAADTQIQNQVTQIQNELGELIEYGKINAMNPPAESELSPLDPEADDNSAALEALVEYCVQNRKGLFIPSGEYHFATPIEINASIGVYIEGETWYRTLFFYDGTGTFLTFTPDNVNINYAHLDKLVLIGNSNANAITVNNAQNWHIDDVQMVGFKIGLTLANSSKTGNNYINRCSLHSDVLDGIGFRVIGENVSTYFYYCFASFTIGGSASSSIGFSVSSSTVMSDISFYACEVANGNIAFDLQCSADNVLSNDIRFIGCVIDGSATGIQLQRVFNAIIANNHFNVAEASGAGGVITRNNCSNILIEGNTFIHMSAATNNKYGVQIYESSADIIGNTFINLKSAIVLQTTQQTNKYFNISNNSIENSVESCDGIYAVGTGFARGIVNANIFRTNKANHDISCSTANTIVTCNAVADVSNTGSNAVTANNIGR